MSIKEIGVSVCVIALLGGACATRPISASEIMLSSQDQELSGWFSGKGEWALFPNRSFKNYNPYTKNENAKCVSIVNGTGRSRRDFNYLTGKHIVVRGYARDYDQLPDGDTPSDRLLSKKYFGEEVVENYCLRQYVFVATELREE